MSPKAKSRGGARYLHAEKVMQRMKETNWFPSSLTSEEERPILANSEFLLTQEGFIGTSNKVHVRLPARSAFVVAANAVTTTKPIHLEVMLFVRRDNEDESERRRRFRIDVLEKCGRSSAHVESTTQFQCQPSWLSWVTGLMLRVEAIQRQERFGSRGHALSLPS
ncbi:hypothetical protein Q3G72_024205 [Acer saccharum]|nr:hypothetical protein Q3G72_024205 [Acer saccharum]